MHVLAILLLGLLVTLWVLRKAAHIPPARLARLVKQVGGLVALAVAALLFVRGRYDFAIGAGGFGLWLLGMATAPEWTKMFRRKGQVGVSRMRSAMIEMEFDPKSEAMDGLVLAGHYENRRLNELSQAECAGLYRDCRVGDLDGARLLETYFDRRFPGWRAARHSEADAGSGNGNSRRSGAMSEDEAYEILGVQKGATRDDISRAHRSLMKKLHPDHGGPASLAAKVNEAKDVLMRRHT